MSKTKIIMGIITVVMSFSLSPGAMAVFLDRGDGTVVSVQINNNGLISVVRNLPDTSAPAKPGANRGGTTDSTEWAHPVCTNLDRAVLRQTIFGQTIIGSTETFERLYDMLVLAAINNTPVRIVADDNLCHPQGWPLIKTIRLGRPGLVFFLPPPPAAK